MIVQKFGGVATRNKEMRELCIHHIKRGIEQHGKVVAVVSAMGRKGEPYSTDSLLSITKSFCTSPEASDLVAACGELISSAVMSAELHAAGITNEIAYGHRTGIFTDSNFTDADLLRVDARKLKELFNEVDCVVVPGYQGVTLDQKFTTLGRGGSDLTAVVLCSVLNGKFVEFYKDVPGVMTEDPKFTKDVKKIDGLNYEQFSDMLKMGSTIIQKKAADFAEVYKIPLHIRSVYNEETGTWIPAKTEA
ncbi:hypothetical protein ACFOZY_02650 [Chungangia koreensis]|uniref:aspartate kinase n=1 Tax=Chungangia koreensis TaxID=752657 RepID=A0ABV8X0P4_9LACT